MEDEDNIDSLNFDKKDYDIRELVAGKEELPDLMKFNDTEIPIEKVNFLDYPDNLV